MFVKLFTEEREMTVMLLVDMSASTFFGSQQQTKRELAAEIAVGTASRWVTERNVLEEIVFCCYSSADLRRYQRLLGSPSD